MPKFSKKLVERIIREELVAHIRELSEKGDKEDEKKDPKKPETQDGEAASRDAKDKPPASANDKNTQHVDPTMDKKKAPGSAPDADAEVPDAPDPADDELEDDGSKDGDEGDDDRGDSKIADEIVGKRVQSITFEPKSKTVPGAVEVVLQFDESPEALKIVITKTGQVKYLYHGLHDRL